MDADEGAANRALEEKRELEVFADFALPCVPLCSRHVGLGLTCISPFACPCKFQLLRRHKARTQGTGKEPPPIKRAQTQQAGGPGELRFSGVCVLIRVCACVRVHCFGCTPEPATM